MNIIIYLLKVLIVVAYGYWAYAIYNFKKAEPKASVKIDLMSRIEIFAAIGINLVGLIAVVDETTYTFTACLCLIGIGLCLSERVRMIIVGNKHVLLRGKIVKIKDIRNISTGYFTLKLSTTKGNIKVMVPLTHNQSLSQLQSKVK